MRRGAICIAISSWNSSLAAYGISIIPICRRWGRQGGKGRAEGGAGGHGARGRRGTHGCQTRAQTPAIKCRQGLRLSTCRT